MHKSISNDPYVLWTFALLLDFKGKALIIYYAWSYFPSLTVSMNNILSIILT